MIRIGKAASVFGRLVNIWKNKNTSLAVKIRLYESLVISTLLYGAESHKWKIRNSSPWVPEETVGITWRDKVKNEDIRKKTGSRKLEDIIKERKLRWLGHVLGIDNSRTARQAAHWELRGYKRNQDDQGTWRKNWVDVLKRDLRQMHLTWEEAEELANDKAEWRRRVAQCSHLDAGWTKV